MWFEPDQQNSYCDDVPKGLFKNEPLRRLLEIEPIR